MVGANPVVTGATEGAEAEPHMVREPRRSWPIVVAKSLPTFLILGVLVAVAFWGHHSGWTLPKFGELMGYCQRRGQLSVLVDHVRAERPNWRGDFAAG